MDEIINTPYCLASGAIDAFNRLFEKMDRKRHMSYPLLYILNPPLRLIQLAYRETRHPVSTIANR